MSQKSSLAEMARKAAESTTAAPPMTHLNAKVNKDLLKKMRIFCAQNDMKIQDFLAEAISDAILSAEKAKKKH
jgi:hypothetical protein